MMPLICHGPLKIGNPGRNGKVHRGEMTLQGLANGQIDQIAGPTLKAKGKARRARRVRMIVVRPAD